MPIGKRAHGHSGATWREPAGWLRADRGAPPGATAVRWSGSKRVAAAFTLLELMIVLTLILILASIAAPTYQVAIVRAREAVLRDDLYTMRKLIDEFTLDKERPPSTLDELVEAGYLRSGIPVDPFTGSNQTWRTDSEDVPIGPAQIVPGIVDVHSGSDDNSLEGTVYSTW
ncbi:MAG: general secretion pathway protein GspG [Acidobacteria bacterium]|nr:MAG: general secretion pathway protein GspG [Acidobacteriota bacterium]